MPLQGSQILTLVHTGLFSHSTLAHAGFLPFNPCPYRLLWCRVPFLTIAHQDYSDASHLPILWINPSPYMIAMLYNPYPCRFPMICPLSTHECYVVLTLRPLSIQSSYNLTRANPALLRWITLALAAFPWFDTCPCKAVALLNPCPYKVPMINTFPHRVVMWHPCPCRVAMISPLSIQVIMFHLCPYSRTRM